MSQLKQHHGVIVPIVTPFTPAGDIDEKGLKAIIENCARNDIRPFVLGTTGEAASIPPAKRAQTVRIAVAAAAGRVPVYAGVGDNCAENSIAAGNEFLRLGAAAVVAHLPNYYGLRPAEMRAFFALLAREIKGGLMIYNIPQTTHMSIPLEVTESLLGTPGIIGYKDSENVAGRPEEAFRRLSGHPDFSLFMGAAVLSAKAMQLGFDGVVPSSGNLAPELWKQFNDTALAGKWTELDALQLRLNAVALVFQKDRILGETLAALKAAMELRGICGRTVLPPLTTLDEAGVAKVRAALAETPLT